MATGTWNELSPAALPPARSYGALAYDSVSDKVILFGGLDAASARLSDTYKWDSSTWTALSPSTVPTARDGMAAASIAGAPAMFGGQDAGGLLNQLYTWDGADWNLQTPLNLVYPTARKYAAIAEDGSGNIYMFGGDTGSSFDPLMWQYVAATGWLSTSPATNPPARRKHSMYYDPDRGRVIMFGGEDPTTLQPLNDVWEWTGGDWAPITPTTVPSERAASQGLAHDPALKRAVLAPCKRAAGSIETPESIYLIDAETFVISDGVTIKTFEMDDDASVSGSNVAVDITGGISASAMRDRIIAAINGAGFNVKAFAGIGGKLFVFDTSPDSRGNVTITEGITSSSFVVSGMTGAEADTWTFNATGAQWTEQDPATLPPLLDGAMMAYDAQAGQDVVMLFGGTADGAAQQRHFEWVWASLGVSPYFSFPGTLQGRVQPSAVQATDGSWVMQLGADQDPLPDFFLDIGDEVTVQQQFYLASHKLLRFDIRARYSPNLPKYKKLLDAGEADFRAPTKIPKAPTAVAAIPGTVPNTDIEFTIDTAVWNTPTEGDPGLQKFTVVYSPGAVRREAYGVAASNPAKVRAGDLMEQSDPPSTTLGDYLISVGDSGLVRTIANGGDRLIGMGFPGAAPLTSAHRDQLLAVSGATQAGNNSGASPFRISDVPSSIGDVGAFGDAAGAIPAGRVAVVENASMVQDLGDAAVTAAVYGAQWRFQIYINVGAGDVLRGELVESLVQADPDGWQRLSLAAHVSKITGIVTLKFVLKLESVTA